jgi:uncharacterized protein
MKYLLVILLILVVFWLWQYERRGQKNPATRPPPSSPGQGGGPTEIVACSVCQVHLPRTEALIGRGARPYCSDAHRRQAEG